MADDWEIKELDPTRPHLVIAEGKEDVLALRRLVREVGRHDMMVGQVGGKDKKFTEKLATIGTLPHFTDYVKSVVVVGDADGDPQGAFQELCRALEAASRADIDLAFVVPDNPGTFASGPPKVGVFLWPRPGEKGCLETLCMESVGSGPRVECIDQFMQCAQDAGAPVRLEGSPGWKARAHAFMATTQDPRAAVGAGFDRSKNVWQMSSDVWKPIKSFLGQL